MAERGERLPPRGSINRTTLGEEVARYLRDALMAGVYRPGERIGIEELAEQLDVSTMPVREALAKMNSEGLLNALPHRGFRVARIARTDFEDVFVIHAFISGLFAERVASTADRALIDDLQELQSQIQQVADQGLAPDETGPRIEQSNFLFHRRINRSTEAERLRWFLRITSQLIPRHFYEDIPGWTHATVTEHQPIIDALAAHDSRRARRLVEDHVTNAGRLVVAHLEDRGFFQQDGGDTDT